MSKLDSQAELIKLGHVFQQSPAELAFLSEIPPDALRMLRESVTEYLIEEDKPLFRGLGKLISKLPLTPLVRIASTLSPMILAGIAVEMPAKKAVNLALKLPNDILANACTFLDPRRARDLIRMFPAENVVDVALELDRRDDFVTMSRFVDFISDDTTIAVEEAIPDESRLLRIAFLMESKNRVDHIFALLPPERIQRMLVRVQEDPQGLLAEFLSLLIHVSYSSKRELGDILANQNVDLINSYILAVNEQGLWDDVLPVVGAMSVPSRKRVVNLPALRETSVQSSILETADSHEHWGQVLNLIDLMGDDNRQAVAGILAAMSDEALSRATGGALIGELWSVLLDLVRRMPEAKQRAFGDILAELGKVDPDLYQRIAAKANDAGITLPVAV